MYKINNCLKNVINKYTWQSVFLLFAPFMYSINLLNGSIRLLDDFYEFARVASFFAILYLFVVVKKKKPSKLIWIIFVMESWQLLITFFTTKKNVVAFYDLSASLAIPMLIELFIDNPKELLKGMILHYELGIYPNLISLLLLRSRYRTGSNPVSTFYLGDHTILIEFFIPAIAVAVLYKYFFKNSKRPFPLIVVSLISCYICKSATTKVAITCAIFTFIIGFLFKKNKNVSIGILFAIALIINVFMVFVYTNRNFNFSVIDNVIVNILHKSTSLTKRDIIWKAALEMIKEKPIFGHGYRTKVLAEGNYLVNHGHNALIDKALVGGIVELGLFLLVNIELIIKSEKQKPSTRKLVLTCLMFGIFMTYITDSYFKFWRFYVVFFLLYKLGNNAKYVNRQMK